MSYQSVQHVFQYSRSSGSSRVVLLAIAERADPDGRRAYPSVETLAAMANISERRVRAALSALQELGELKVHYKAGPHGCNVYSVHCGPAAASGPAVDPDGIVRVAPDAPASDPDENDRVESPASVFYPDGIVRVPEGASSSDLDGIVRVAASDPDDFVRVGDPNPRAAAPAGTPDPDENDRVQGPDSALHPDENDRVPHTYPDENDRVPQQMPAADPDENDRVALAGSASHPDGIDRVPGEHPDGNDRVAAPGSAADPDDFDQVPGRKRPGLETGTRTISAPDPDDFVHETRTISSAKPPIEPPKNKNSPSPAGALPRAGVDGGASAGVGACARASPAQASPAQAVPAPEDPAAVFAAVFPEQRLTVQQLEQIRYRVRDAACYRATLERWKLNYPHLPHQVGTQLERYERDERYQTEAHASEGAADTGSTAGGSVSGAAGGAAGGSLGARSRGADGAAAAKGGSPRRRRAGRDGDPRPDPLTDTAGLSRSYRGLIET